MAFVAELFKSDQGITTYDGKRDRSTLLYLCSGYNSRANAYAALAAIAPATNSTDGLALQSIELEQASPNSWIGRCEYGTREKLDVGDYTFAWDTTGGTAHVTVPIDAKAYARAGYDAPEDLKLVILADRDRRAQGVDVPAPTLKLTISYRMPRATITLDWVKDVAACVGRTNNAPFAGFDTGELLFLGSTGRYSSTSDLTVDFQFLASSNVEGMTIGEITGIDKGGHQYLWPWFEEVKDSSADELVPKPAAIYVDTVVESADFMTLRLDNVDGGSTSTTTTPE